MPRKCQWCGEEETDSNLVGWCELAEEWVCQRCCEKCYEASYPYGCPEVEGLQFDRDDEEE